jgi:biotin carboxyl carrier protein
MQREILVNGKPLLIDLDEFSARASIVEPEPGVYSVIVDGKSYAARVTGGGKSKTTVAIGSREFEVEIVDPREPRVKSGALAGEGRQTLAAPMPGKIIRVLVVVGDAVAAGQGLVVMEAMKMQNEMKAVRPGTVVSLNVVEGGTVAAGDVLVIIE